ncbi:hypothetical protein WKH57_15305 [Niallia taxi]|uniref:hypothetical protein n=1 Tax=Niallia taxi TaxID=2499688 RepID=UPI00316E3A2A
MPIQNIEGTKQLHFGFGDIEVAPGLLELEDESVGVVAFLQNVKENPIGLYTDYPEGKSVDISETPVRMVFEKVESIDVVIWALEKAKKMMLSGTVKI